MFQVFIDGASKNNPGSAGAGYLILEDGWPLKADAIPLGIQTNNKAEYEALLAAFNYIFNLARSSASLGLIEIYTDSQLIIGHLTKNWKIKDHMKPYVNRADNYLRHFDCRFNKISREKNEVADYLSNLGVMQNEKI